MREEYCSTLLAILAGSAILIYWYIDPYREAEFYFYENKHVMLFYLIRIAYFALVIAAVVNMRYLLSTVVFDKFGQLLSAQRRTNK